jgi:hypothetical protein
MQLNIDEIKDPEQLSTLVDKILTERQSQRITMPARFGSAMSKVYPLLSITLGIGSAVAEGSSFVPVKGLVNGLSMLLSVCKLRPPLSLAPAHISM